VSICDAIIHAVGPKAGFITKRVGAALHAKWPCGMGKKFDFKPYRQGEPLFDQDLWDACGLTIDGIRKEQEGEWIEEELRILTKKLRKKIRKGELKMKKIERLAELNVKVNFKRERGNMIQRAYKIAIIQRGGHGSKQAQEIVQRKLREKLKE